ncbi:MAG: WG repeat-containing protein [Paludibacteraceae bacterium]|nr:WG repeat-containing protein [Paludibacteraceae bacterium]
MRTLSFKEGETLAFHFGYEDYSEPLAEYNVLADGQLIPTATSNTLIGVKRNNRWGWIDSENNIILPFVFDSGFVICYDGIIILQKDGKWGGIYRNDLTTAFDFRYGYLSHMYHSTYMASQTLGGLYALLRSGDVFLTDYKYQGFLENGHKRYVYYVRTNIFGMQVRGEIDLETGRELS